MTYGTGVFFWDERLTPCTTSVSSIGLSTMMLLGVGSLTVLWHVHAIEQMSNTELTGGKKEEKRLKEAYSRSLANVIFTLAGGSLCHVRCFL
jgi:hypothetical protein